MGYSRQADVTHCTEMLYVAEIFCHKREATIHRVLNITDFNWACMYFIKVTMQQMSYCSFMLTVHWNDCHGLNTLSDSGMGTDSDSCPMQK